MPKARPLRDAINKCRNFVDDTSYDEACDMARATLQHLLPYVPVDTGRLVNSGFAYVDGTIVAESNLGTTTGIYGISTPIPPSLPTRREGRHTITIIFTTPKPAGPNATVYYIDAAGNKMFDYAPYVLGEKAYVSKEISYTLTQSIMAKVGFESVRRLARKWSMK